jgi:hypothetical protein
MVAFEIKWDLKDDVYDYNIDECDIPTRVEIPKYITDDCVTEQELCDAVADYLSDTYGFCVIEFGLR